MPHQTEPNANNALAVVIRGMLPSCTVLPETTQVFPDHPGRYADVLKNFHQGRGGGLFAGRVALFAAR